MSRWRRVVGRELARFEEQTESDVLRGTLVDHAGDRIEVDVDAAYLEHRNQTLDWW